MSPAEARAAADRYRAGAAWAAQRGDDSRARSCAAAADDLIARHPGIIDAPISMGDAA